MAATHPQIQQLFQSIYDHCGYDFRQYSTSSTQRRVDHHLKMHGYVDVASLEKRILNDDAQLDLLLRDLSINVTEMFRNPAFFLSLRQTILPQLMAYEPVKIWHAGCATGEEVYSMAILLAELGLTPRCRLYATDFNAAIVAQAKKGVFPLSKMRDYTRHYQASGGQASFSDYYHAQYDNAVMSASLKNRVLFSYHDLTHDGSIGMMQMILCRNVLIYFNRDLQTHILRMFYESLEVGGYLCLGAAEDLRGSPLMSGFKSVDQTLRIYQKVGTSSCQ